jgi:ATP-binding cassette, subfamily C, bacterial
MMINKRLINTCSESKKYIGLTVLANWSSAICNFTVILLAGRIINSTVTATGGYTVTATGVLVLLALRFTLNILYGRFSHKASAAVKVKLRDMIYEKLLRLGLNYNEAVSTSGIVQATVEGVEALEVYFGRYLPQLFYALLAPITLFVILSFISLRTAVVFIICVPLIPLSIVAIMKIAKRILKKFWNSYSNLGDTFLDNLQGLTTLKIFNIDEERHRKMNEEAEAFRKVTMKVLSMQLNSITVMDFIAYGGAALGSIVALNEFKSGSINVGQVIVIILLSSEFFIPLRLLGSFFHIAMNGMAAADNIFLLLDSEERDGARFSDSAAEEAAATSQGKFDPCPDIEVSGVTFSYGSETEVIKEVSMLIPHRSFTAIVGESGSGKSTIASLLLNIYDVQKGRIFLQGIDIGKLPFTQIYEKIALISTNSYIFNGSILDNLTMAKEKASEAEIVKALELANLKDFVSSLEKGLHTKVGEGGALLSGGQKQRLALARAILANREILVFDEATSNIDVESEEKILSSIDELSKERTIILISHRLANVRRADCIYVMDKGRVAEAGSHEELMKLKGKYFKLIREQSVLEGGMEDNGQAIRI